MKLSRVLFAFLLFLLLAVIVPAAIAQTTGATVVTAPTTVPAKIIAISVFVYAVLQALKKTFEALGVRAFSGKAAIIWNIALSALGVVAVAQPGDLLSLKFLLELATTVAGAAGVHGLAGNFYSKPDVQKLS